MIGIHPITETDIRKLLSNQHDKFGFDVVGRYYEELQHQGVWQYLCTVCFEKTKDGIGTYNTDHNVEIIKNALESVNFTTITELKAENIRLDFSNIVTPW